MTIAPPRERGPWACVLLAVVVLLMTATGAGAATFNVNSTADAVDANPGNGICATAGGQCTLRAAVMEANGFGGSDTINLPSGTYTLALTGTGEGNAASGDLDIKSTIAIVGANQATTIIDGNLTDRVFDIETLASLTISNTTIRRGSIGDTGGAIQFFGALTMTDCTVSNNSSGSTSGGGLFTDNSGASLALTRVTISGNGGSLGAGIYMKDIPTATIVDSEISGNTATGEGGGLFLEQVSVSLTRVLIDGNDGGAKGGGVSTKGGSCVTLLTNVTISGNTVTGEGGGIMSNGDQTDLLHVTLTDNSAPTGAGISKGAGTVTAKSTIIASNVGDNCAGGVDSLGYNVDSANTCAFANTGDLINTDPLLGTLQDNGGLTQTHALLTGSPAIDTATNTGCPATDQRGEARPADGDGNASSICDIGSFEVTPVVLYTLSGTVFEDVNYGGGAGRNRATALGAGGSGRNGARVELYDAGGGYVDATTTAGGGAYSFDVPAGDYTVRVVNASVGSARTGYVASLRAVQTFRTDAASGTAAAVTDHVGGQDPSVADAGDGGFGTAMNTTTGVFTAGTSGTAQSIAPVTVTAAAVSALDFGYNFDTLVNVNDAGQGSLRQAIANANALGGDASLAQDGRTAAIENVIFMVYNGDNPAPAGMNTGYPNQFAGGVATIRPLTGLPDIAAPLVLDASTQPGFAGTPVIAIDGILAPGIPAAAGFVLTATADGGTLRGLIVRNWSGDGIEIQAGSDGSVVAGNYIGRLNAAGADSGGGTQNVGDGVYIAGSGNLIGGVLTADRNVISGNDGAGVRIDGETADSNLVLGNRIGLLADGSATLINGADGIAVAGGGDNTVIGGAATDSGNWIAPGGGDGIDLVGITSGTLIRGNRIGTDLAGSANWGAQFAGINIEGGAFDNTIGGTATGEGNIIAFSGQGGPANPVGVRVQPDAEAGNEISGNSIYSSVGIGIDLGVAGVTANDGAKSAGEPNVLMDQPVFTGAALSGTNLTVTGYVGSAPGQALFAGARVEVFESDNDATGFGEGQTYLGLLTADGSGNFAGSLDVSGLGLAIGEPVSATATDAAGNTSEFGANFVVTAPSSDLVIAVTDAPDPAPLNGPLIYSILITNNGPSTASNVVVTDVLPAGVNFVSANLSQGSCSGTTTITCTLGAILNTGTASVELQVTTTATGTITNTASVTADQADPVAGNNSASNDTLVTTGSSFDVPLTQQLREAGFLDYTVTGASLRAGSNTSDACSVNPTASASIAGIPGSATIRSAYLYWAGSGAATDANVTLDAAAVPADRTFESDFVLGANTYEFFGGVADVTAAVVAKRNGAYTFGGLSVDTGGSYCSAQAVIAGWSLIVIYEDTSLSGKTLVLYDGFDLTRNGSSAYVLSGIFASGPPEAKTTSLLWEGDESLGGTNEALLFNGGSLSDAFNPVNNVYNSSINTLGSTTAYGLDLDTFDVSGQVSVGDTLATTQVDTGPDLVILNAVVLQVKTNVIVGTVFEDVNYGGGPGRDLAAAAAAAPGFAAGRPGARVELYDSGGTFLRDTNTDASGLYGFSGLPNGAYQVRVVNDSVASSRPGATGAEWPVQTFRTDASGALAPVTGEVGGDDPTAQDDPANLTSADLSTFAAQSVAPVTISLAVTKTAVDFGYNFDTIVNANNAGQGSLRQFIDNANLLTNANLAQSGLTAGVEHSVFMIPSNADPLGRAADPNFDAGRGVARIGVTSLLPAVTDANTSIDGTLQTTLIGNTNAAVLGTGGMVGTGPDGVPGSADEIALAQVQGPEIEIVDGAGVDFGIDLQADDVTLRGLAIYGFGNNPSPFSTANVRVDDGVGYSGHLLENNVFGAAADSFTDPGPGSRTGGYNVLVRGADGGTLRTNLIGYAEQSGVNIRDGVAGWTVQGNEVRGNSTFGYGIGDGIAIEGAGATGASIVGNLIDGNGASGIEMFGADGGFTITDNTIVGNGAGTGAGAVETSGVRVYGSGTSLVNNVIRNSYGAGVMVANGATGNLISRNSIDVNGSVSGQIGIDLLAPTDDPNTGSAPFVSANDGAGDADSGGNNRQNYPDLANATTLGGSLNVSGTLTSQATTTYTLEFFTSPAASGSGFGEGAQYIGSDTVSTNGAGSVTFLTTLPVSVPVGTPVSVTATSPGNDTSEFSNSVTTQTNLGIYKRAFNADGTPIPSGSTLPVGVPFYYLLYINNRDGARTDVSMQDVLDPVFAYRSGTLRVDNTVAACAAALCTPAEEAAIFASAVGVAPLSDAIDGDVASYSAGSTTIDVGNQNAANAQFDTAANRIAALLFSVRLQ